MVSVTRMNPHYTPANEPSLHDSKEQTKKALNDIDGDDISVATTVDTCVDQELLATGEKERIVSPYIAKRVLIMMVLWMGALYGLLYLDSTGPTTDFVLFFPILVILWIGYRCYRHNPEGVTNCLMECGKVIGFVTCSLSMIGLALLPWILYFKIYRCWFCWQTLLVSFAQYILNGLGQKLWTKCCNVDEPSVLNNKTWDFVVRNLFAFGYKWAFFRIFLGAHRFLNVSINFFMGFILFVNSIGELSVWKIILSMFLAQIYVHTSDLAAMILVEWMVRHYFNLVITSIIMVLLILFDLENIKFWGLLGLCISSVLFCLASERLVEWTMNKFEGRLWCWNGNVLCSKAASLQQTNDIAMAETV